MARAVRTDILPDGEAYSPAAARYILTLRYNPLLAPVLPAVTPHDMRPVPPPSPSPEIVERLAAAALHGILDAAPDARVAVSLSGGVDSALVLGLIRKHFPDLSVSAISVRFGDGYDETELAARIAESLGVERHTVVTVDDYMRELPAAISAVALPMWDLHWYYVAKQAAAESADVLISGDGGDELFGGYTFRYGGFMSAGKKGGIGAAGLASPDQKVRAYLDNHARDYVPDQEMVFGPRMNFSWDDVRKVLLPYFGDNGLDPLEQVFLADYNGKMSYNFAHVSDAMARRFGIRTASPFLSDDMIRHAMGIQAAKKYDAESGVGKLPLRALLRSVANVEHLMSDSKMGFSPDTVSYWRRCGYDACSLYLGGDSSRTVSNGWISGKWIMQNMSRDVQDVRYVNKFLGLLAFEVWYRIFITRDLDPATKLS